MQEHNEMDNSAVPPDSESGHFRTESALVHHFLELLEDESCPWGEVQSRQEFFYTRGRTDVVALTEEGAIVAFEAKLARWRDAMHQAYRNTSFAHESYVLLPENVAKRAFEYAEEFDRRSVGLCYISDNRVIVLIQSARCQPLQQWLASKATAFVKDEDECPTQICTS
jgi:hypothetical protein